MAMHTPFCNKVSTPDTNGGVHLLFPLNSTSPSVGPETSIFTLLLGPGLLSPSLSSTTLADLAGRFLLGPAGTIAFHFLSHIFFNFLRAFFFAPSNISPSVSASIPFSSLTNANSMAFAPPSPFSDSAALAAFSTFFCSLRNFFFSFFFFRSSFFFFSSASCFSFRIATCFSSSFFFSSTAFHSSSNFCKLFNFSAQTSLSTFNFSNRASFTLAVFQSSWALMASLYFSSAAAHSSVKTLYCSKVKPSSVGADS
ncbi:hypothetical protein EV421DRAFT_1923456 [Armillaria borealis]|uniref:Uncharacterized protein n=1 Tax=Armillaria borealis TaxID=47425 RepID=A0AA39MVA6_9AGAR|nr:hypothetical protein EV421DRAFT_1923456 [Armillaria borealis]